MNEERLGASKKKEAEPGSGNATDGLKQDSKTNSPREPTSPKSESFNDWIETLVLPLPLSIGSLVLAAFLVFPAYRGFTLGERVRQLEGQANALQYSLDAEKAQSLELKRKLAEGDLQPQSQQRPSSLTQSSEMGLFLSPLLSLEPTRSKISDLISLNFSQSDRAVLLFSPPKRGLEEIEVNILQSQRLVWTQVLQIPPENLSNQDLIAFVLSKSILSPGTYQITVDGNPRKQRIPLAQFDLSVE